MTLLMRDQENIEKGIEKGIAKGQEMMLELVQKLVEDGRHYYNSELKKNQDNSEKLFKEYGI